MIVNVIHFINGEEREVVSRVSTEKLFGKGDLLVTANAELEKSGRYWITSEYCALDADRQWIGTDAKA